MDFIHLDSIKQEILQKCVEDAIARLWNKNIKE
jgi:hypothetical protein